MFTKLKIRTKLFAVMTLLALVAFIIMTVGISKLGEINGRLNFIVDNTSTKCLLAARAQQDLLAIHRAEKNLILADDPAGMDVYAAEIDNTENNMRDKVEQLRQLADAEEKTKLDEFDELYNNFKTISAEVRAASRKNTNKEAFELSRNEGRKQFDAAEVSLKQIADRNDKQSTELTRTAETMASQVLKGARLVQDLIRVQRAEKNLILATNREDRGKYDRLRKDTVVQVRAATDELRKMATGEDAKHLDSFRTQFDAFEKTSDRVAENALKDETEEATRISAGEGRDVFDKAEAYLRQFVDSSDQSLAQCTKSADEAATRAILAARCVQDLIALQRAEKNLILAKDSAEMDEYRNNIGIDTVLEALRLCKEQQRLDVERQDSNL